MKFCSTNRPLLNKSLRLAPDLPLNKSSSLAAAALGVTKLTSVAYMILAQDFGHTLLCNLSPT
jgi:hypothetical protein